MEKLPQGIPIQEIETVAILKKTTSARAALAELKGVIGTIPNQQILIDTLSLQEAKDSSEVEDIVTTHDEIYSTGGLERKYSSSAAKEVHQYADALRIGFEKVQKQKIIHLNLILSIQEQIEGNNAGIRKQPGTTLRNDQTKEVVYTPPQDYDTIIGLLTNLEKFINDEVEFDVDPLIKMAIIHHRFESIHPFYDGNGRTGRILNILYLVQQDLLSLPVLYISRYIIQHRALYYELLQATRDNQKWEPWVSYILDAVEQTALETIESIKEIKQMMMQAKHDIRENQPKIYSQDLINIMFRHPYIRIGHLKEELRISRITATKYLEKLCEMQILVKLKIGRGNYYINHGLMNLLQKGPKKR